MRVSIFVISAIFVFMGSLCAENENITEIQDEFVPKVADFEKIKIGLTTEKDIIAIFGEPHMVLENGVLKENKSSACFPGVAWDGIIKECQSYDYFKRIPDLKPSQKLFGYAFPYIESEGIMFFVIINKDKKIVEWLYRRAVRSPYSDLWFHRRTRSPSPIDSIIGEYHNF